MVGGWWFHTHMMCSHEGSATTGCWGEIGNSSQASGRSCAQLWCLDQFKDASCCLRTHAIQLEIACSKLLMAASWFLNSAVHGSSFFTAYCNLSSFHPRRSEPICQSCISCEHHHQAGARILMRPHRALPVWCLPEVLRAYSTGSTSGRGRHLWTWTELQKHLHAGECAEEIHKNSQKRRWLFNDLLWWAEVHHQRNAYRLNMNYFEFLQELQPIWVMKFTFAVALSVTSMASGDVSVVGALAAGTLNRILSMPCCCIWQSASRQNANGKMPDWSMKHAVVRKVHSSFWALVPQPSGMLLLKWPPIAGFGECKTRLALMARTTRRMTRHLLWHKSMWSRNFAGRVMRARHCICFSGIMVKSRWMHHQMRFCAFWRAKASFVLAAKRELTDDPLLHLLVKASMSEGGRHCLECRKLKFIMYLAEDSSRTICLHKSLMSCFCQNKEIWDLVQREIRALRDAGPLRRLEVT